MQSYRIIILILGRDGEIEKKDEEGRKRRREKRSTIMSNITNDNNDKVK